jgi:thiamine pyrophosphate-dependent acetolactate synthase large subunit-like protein
MSKASKPVFYTGGGVINSGPKASELLRELVSLYRVSHYLNTSRFRSVSG